MSSKKETSVIKTSKSAVSANSPGNSPKTPFFVANAIPAKELQMLAVIMELEYTKKRVEDQERTMKETLGVSKHLTPEECKAIGLEREILYVDYERLKEKLRNSLGELEEEKAKTEQMLEKSWGLLKDLMISRFIDKHGALAYLIGETPTMAVPLKPIDLNKLALHLARFKQYCGAVENHYFYLANLKKCGEQPTDVDMNMNISRIVNKAKCRYSEKNFIVPSSSRRKQHAEVSVELSVEMTCNGHPK